MSKQKFFCAIQLRNLLATLTNALSSMLIFSRCQSFLPLCHLLMQNHLAKVLSVSTCIVLLAASENDDANVRHRKSRSHRFSDLFSPVSHACLRFRKLVGSRGIHTKKTYRTPGTGADGYTWHFICLRRRTEHIISSDNRIYPLVSAFTVGDEFPDCFSMAMLYV